MSAIDCFQWWRQAPFAAALFQTLSAAKCVDQCIAANAVFQIVTGLTEQQLTQSQASQFNLRALYFSVNTGLYYQVHSYAPIPGYQLVTLHQLPDIALPQHSTPASGADKLSSILLTLLQRFISVTPSQQPAILQQTLQELGEAVEADRVYIFDYDFAAQSCTNTYEWCATGIMPEIESLKNVPLAAIPQWVSTHQAGYEMYIPDVPSLPDGDALKLLLQPQGIKSLLALPIRAESKLLGFVGFDSVRQYHYYTEQERLLLSVFARSLANLKH
ncbi:GAF domain-containing protein [Alishewanella jeotgali]|uniref:Multi-sensor hybrid histidine kinase n=1 Tax=Alishewanella jeotgali KCTC 22429 TaxID=1129374 RepID=H3ZHP1_9ALTE|nr:GAF domain-containing protein [Alishewanella jeotgali]EHR39897.1 multi-sensor hybrid histidine kinase [Alishewanella jeotgali KCTC 22429]